MTRTNQRNARKPHRRRPRSAEARGASFPEGVPDPEEDLIASFVAARGPKNPEDVAMVLGTALQSTRSLRDFAAGGWILSAPMCVGDFTDVRGFQAGRIFQTIERFVEWMHGRGYVDAWERLHLQHEIDQSRYCHGVRREPPPGRGLEGVLRKGALLDDRTKQFTASRTHPLERDLAPSAIRVLLSQLDLQLGEGSYVPFGALDVDAFVRRIVVDDTSVQARAANCTLFAIAAGYYTWLGAHGHLDSERAAAQAAKLSAAALGTQVALGLD